eukprot:TRINITY_DN4753_c0_g1_i1.p1 TRINITY_DN4753_c0_g1~~TRINITY_DN4753_c0_g1_i1.p1  ORF type:complete len:259 (-),score=42.73 TRINITY_DN4753_c0_g1_i1:4-780(-)
MQPVEDPSSLLPFEKEFVQSARLGGTLRSKYTNFKWSVDSLPHPKVILGVCDIRPSYNFSASDENCLAEVLRNTKFSKDVQFRLASLDFEHVETVQKVLNEMGFYITYQYDYDTWKLLPERADMSKLRELAKGVEGVRLEDAPVLNYFWSYSTDESLRYIKYLIEKTCTGAVYVGNQIAAWGVLHTDSTIGMVHTKEEYRGKGFAKKVIAYLALKILEVGATPVCHVSDDNIPSIKCMEALDFVKGEKVSWILAKYKS